MIGEQHQRAADQVGGVLVVRRPGPRDLQMQRLGRGSALSMVATRSRTMRAPTIARPSAARVKAPGSALAASASTAMARSIGAARRAASAIARISSETSGQLSGAKGSTPVTSQSSVAVCSSVSLLGEIDAIDAAVDRPVLGDGRDRRIHHRQIGVETAQAARLRRRHAPLLQRRGRPRPGSGCCANPATARSGSGRG